MLDLKAICEALGWQGGTIHQAIAGIKSVCAERDEPRARLAEIEGQEPVGQND